MKKLLFVVISTIMISGLLLGGIDSNVFATKDDNNGKAKGCENASTKSKGIEKNPHCSGGSSGPIPPNDCDVNPKDGSITSSELGLPNNNLINSIEQTVLNNGGDSNDNDKIDTLDEWNQLEIEQPSFCDLI